MLKKLFSFLTALALCFAAAVPLADCTVSAAGGYGEYFYTALDRTVFFSAADLETRTINKDGSIQTVSVLTLHPDCKITVRPNSTWQPDNEDGGGWPNRVLIYFWFSDDGSRYHTDNQAFDLLTGSDPTKLFQKTDGSQLIALGSGSGQEIFLALSSEAAAGSWVKIGSGYGFILEGGESVTGRWLKDDGKWYHFDLDGIMQTGWYLDADQSYYYFQPDGSMKTGWLKQGSSWYYLNPASGEMAAGSWCVIDGKYYHFAKSGAMQTGWFQDTDGSWFYFQSDGAALCNGWHTIGGRRYYFQENGVLRE